MCEGMTEHMLQVISFVATILAGIFTYLEKRNIKYDNFLNIYFKEVLNPYIVKLKKNKDLDTIKFMKKKLKESENNIYIPHYISYLIENDGDQEKLQKVLATDYIQNYPNNKNRKGRLIDSVNDCLNIIVEFLMILVFCVAIIFISISVGGIMLEVFVGESTNTMVEYIIITIISVILILISIIMIKQMNKSEKDYYTLEEEKIKKCVKEKIEYYDNNYSKYFL